MARTRHRTQDNNVRSILLRYPNAIHTASEETRRHRLSYSSQAEPATNFGAAACNARAPKIEEMC